MQRAGDWSEKACCLEEDRDSRNARISLNHKYIPRAELGKM